MRIQLFGGRGAGFAPARHAMMALWVGAAIMSLGDSVSGQAPASQAAVEAPRPWPPARLPDGQPDVQGGLWRATVGGTSRLDNPIPTNTRFDAASGRPVQQSQPSRIVDPPDGQVPYQPWAAARKKQQEIDLENPTRAEHIDTQQRCLTSAPRLYYFPGQFRILQPPGSVVFVWEVYHYYRVISLDRSPHMAPNVKLWMGDARGHWEGQTLVVDTTNLNGKSRLTSSGDFFSDNVHLVERFTFVDANTINYEVTIDDPTVFTRPWTMRVTHRRGAEEEVWENACHEGTAEERAQWLDRLVTEPLPQAKPK